MSSDPESNTSTHFDQAIEAWGYAMAAAACPACKSTFVVPPDAHNQICPVCFSSNLAGQPDPRIGGTPELALPFAIDRQRTGSLVENWLKGLWLRPADLSVQALISRLTASFSPMWLVDGTVTGCWQAQVGFDYQVASSKEDFDNGQWITHKVTETRIRWEPRSGTVQRSYNNLAVPAMETHAQIMSGLGRFPIEQAVAYTPEIARNVPVRLPDLSTGKAWPQAKIRFDAAACQECQAAAGAQHVDHFSIEADYPQPHWTLLLLPILSSYYRDDDGKITPVWINGRTGQIFGALKASQKAGWRWTGVGVAAGLVCIAIALVFSLLTAVFPPSALLGGLLFITGILILLASPVPAVWAWQYNRSHGSP